MGASGRTGSFALESGTGFHKQKLHLASILLIAVASHVPPGQSTSKARVQTPGVLPLVPLSAILTSLV